MKIYEVKFESHSGDDLHFTTYATSIKEAEQIASDAYPSLTIIDCVQLEDSPKPVKKTHKTKKQLLKDDICPTFSAKVSLRKLAQSEKIPANAIYTVDGINFKQINKEDGITGNLVNEYMSTFYMIEQFSRRKIAKTI